AIYPLVQHLSQGVPREVNHIVGRLLLYGALEEKHRLTEEDLWVVVKELNRERRMGFELDGDLESFKRKLADAQPKSESDRVGTPHPQPPTAEAVEAGDAEAAPAESDKHAAEDAEVAVGEAEVEAPMVQAEAETAVDTDNQQVGNAPGDREPAAADAAAGFEATDALLREQVDEDATTFGMSGMYARSDDNDQIEELPSIEMTRRYDPREHKPHSHLLTDVDDLLDEKPVLARGLRGIWRWLFYPSAIVILALMILGPKPEEILGYWEQTWNSFRQTYLDAAGELPEGTLSTVQPDKAAAVSGGEAADQPPAHSATPGMSAPDSEPIAEPTAEPTTDQVAERTQAPAEMSIETPKAETPVPAVSAAAAPSATETTAGDSADTQPVDRVDKTSAQAGGLVAYDRPYHLTVNEATGELTAPSRPLFFAALDLLRANQQALLVVTGISGPADNPLDGMRTALKEADLAATLFLEAGVAQKRISVEGGRPEDGRERALASPDEAQAASLKTVRFKVVDASGGS
ncbi:MAG: hypothetical protein P8178_16715, partial [Candidatus Thiodiazotropha sp.]